MEFLVVASNYRTEKKHVHVFLDNVVQGFVDRGHTCNVIAPQSISSYLLHKSEAREFVSERETVSGNKYIVYSPLFVVWLTKKIGNVCLSDFSKKSYFRAIKRVVRKNKLHADCVYSHFLQAAFSANMLAKYLGVPSFFANGEADTIDSVKYNSRSLIARTLNETTGIISVSSKCKEEISVLCNNDPDIMDKIVVIPNAIDPKRFYQKDKMECREKLGFPKDDPIVVFTGSFIERKGIRHLSNVLDKLDGVYSVFIGTGTLKPECKNQLFCGHVDNAKMVDYLNAADLFVLPTQAEGCCNAIVEAMGCGLPIVSSNLSFNWDILDDSNSIMIEPENEEMLKAAIESILSEPELKERLGNGSLNRAKELVLDQRVERILSFIKQRMQLIKHNKWVGQ